MHEFRMRSRCPVNGATDLYEVTVETDKLVKVEDILKAAASFTEPAFQEEITQKLATALECRVTTIGHHSGVRTTCIC
jgi:hypothetical protein